MFVSCDGGFQLVSTTLDEENRTLNLYESGSVLDALFQLLHSTPAPFEPPPPPTDFTRIQETIPEAAIPCPLLPALFALADKYALSQEIVQTLQSHLSAYASTFPLQVYGCAVGFGMPDIAVEASAHLLHPPLTSYTPEEIKIIPTAQAYHRLVLLHELRIRKLGEVLEHEEIFPHGYGECGRHAERTKSLWLRRKATTMSKIQAGESQATYRTAGVVDHR